MKVFFILVPREFSADPRLSPLSQSMNNSPARKGKGQKSKAIRTQPSWRGGERGSFAAIVRQGSLIRVHVQGWEAQKAITDLGRAWELTVLSNSNVPPQSPKKQLVTTAVTFFKSNYFSKWFSRKKIINSWFLQDNESSFFLVTYKYLNITSHQSVIQKKLLSWPRGQLNIHS